MNQALKRKRFHMLTATAFVVAIGALIYIFGSVLFTILLSALIAYVLLPLAKMLISWMPWRDSRPELSRALAISAIFVAAGGATAAILAVAVPPTVNQLDNFIEEFPTFFASARETVEGWVGTYSDRVPQQVRLQIEDYAASMGSVLAESAFDVLPDTVGFITGSFSLIIGLATMPVLVFYFAKDSAKIGSYLISPFPSDIRTYLMDISRIADRTIGGYIRGQLILGMIVGVAVTIGLMALGIPFAAVLGVVAGISELVPIVGPWIGGAAGVLVALATAPEKIVWVALLYLGIQIVENVLLVPRVQAHTLNLHPAAVIVVIIVASQFFGFWGIILGPPLLSLAKDIVKYLADEWDRPPVAQETGEIGLSDDQGPGDDGSSE